MRARLVSRCRSTRGPVGQGSQVSIDAVPHTAMRARGLMNRRTVSVIAPEAKVGDGKPATAAETLPVIVIAEKFQANRTNQPALTEQRIFDLSDRPEFDAAGIKKLIEAIDFAMQANDTAEQMKIRFHEPSRLLFAKGPHDSISLFDEVVNTFLDKK